MQAKVEQLTSQTYNSCLLNLYRSGRDTMAWHSDNEPLYGSEPVIGMLLPGNPLWSTVFSTILSLTRIRLPSSRQLPYRLAPPETLYSGTTMSASGASPFLWAAARSWSWGAGRRTSGCTASPRGRGARSLASTSRFEKSSRPRTRCKPGWVVAESERVSKGSRAPMQ